MKDLIRNIVHRAHTPVSSQFSRELRALLDSMLHKNMRQRPSINSLLQIPCVMSRTAKYLNETQKKQEFSHTVLHGKHILKGAIPPPLEDNDVLPTAPKLRGAACVEAAPPPPPPRNANGSPYKAGGSPPPPPGYNVEAEARRARAAQQQRELQAERAARLRQQEARKRQIEANAQAQRDAQQKKIAAAQEAARARVLAQQQARAKREAQQQAMAAQARERLQAQRAAREQERERKRERNSTQRGLKPYAWPKRPLKRRPLRTKRTVYTERE